VPLGLAPEFGSSLLLPRRLGVQRASRALLLGEPIAAQEAVSMGLASECLAPEAVLPRALEAVARLNAAPASAAIAAKRLMRLREASEIQAAISIEARTFAAQLMNPATQATLRAVFEKRGGRT
jgi:enoyl-CoA hydratase/carnithine racemase